MALEFAGKYVRLYSGLFNRGSFGYQVRYYDERQKRKTKMVPDGVMPLEYAQDLDRKIGLMGVQHVQSKRKFKDLLPKYIDDLDEQLQRHKTNAKYGKKISVGTHKKAMVHINNHILPVFADVDVAHIRPSTVQDFLENLEKKMAPQTANQVKNTLGRIMSFFVRKEFIEINPCREVRPLAERPAQSGHTPTQHDVQKVLMHCKLSWHEVLIRLCAETGVRCSEALGLEWSSVRNDVLWIHQSAVRNEVGPTKTRNGKRKVKVSKQTALMLKEMRVKSISKFVFTNEEGRLFTSSDALNQALKPACIRAGVTPFGFHGLRRLVINTLLDRNVMKDHVQKLVGHSIGSRVTDRHYRQIADEDVLLDEYVLDFDYAISA